MSILVTGADGFVGRHLVRRLLEAGDTVLAGCRPGGPEPAWRNPAGGAVEVVPLEITDPASVTAALARAPSAIVHLAAVASVREARADPGAAWTVNAAGTARLVAAAAALCESGRADPTVLLISTGEVYGVGPPAPRRETDPLAPVSPYAASKVGAEVAALEAWRRAGLRVIVARPFPHTGAGQNPQYVVPAFARRLQAARREGAATVPTGNLEPIRDLLDVRDVVEAYRLLLAHGAPGEAYNVARGEGVSLAQLFERLAALIGSSAAAQPDPSLVRGSDIPHLVGDSTKLRRATGWVPAISFEQTLQDLVHAEAD